MVAYTLQPHVNGDPWETIVVIFNANSEDKEMELPGPDWVIVVNKERAGTDSLGEIQANRVVIPPRTSLVLVDGPSLAKSWDRREGGTKGIELEGEGRAYGSVGDVALQRL